MTLDRHAPSLFDLIKEQQQADPNRPLDYTRFPEPLATSIARFVPGALDALAGRFNEKPDHWQVVKTLIASLKTGRVSTTQLEASLRTVRAAPNVDELLRHLTASDVPEYITRAFWTIAKRSGDYEAVKWGIAIGALRLQDEYVSELLSFARHSEFTTYAVVALLRACEQRPGLRSFLTPLLAVTEGWGTVRIIDFIGRDRSMADNLDVVRAVTIYGVENSAGLLVEVGHKIARQLNAAVFDLARSDERLFVAIVLLMEEILTTDHPLGGILDVPEPQVLVDEYFRLLASTKPNIWVVQGMRTAQKFFDDPACPLENRIQRSASLALMLGERISTGIVRTALIDEKARWVALQIVDQDGMLELMPDLERLAVEHPRADILKVLVRHGDRRQQELLLDLLPTLVDFNARATRPFSSTNLFWPDRDDVQSEYAAIVSAMGVIATRDAVRHLKMALADFNPFVRSEACESAANLPPDMVDGELVKLLDARKHDPLAYVRESAESTLRKLDLRR